MSHYFSASSSSVAALSSASSTSSAGELLALKLIVISVRIRMYAKVSSSERFVHCLRKKQRETEELVCLEMAKTSPNDLFILLGLFMCYSNLRAIITTTNNTNKDEVTSAMSHMKLLSYTLRNRTSFNVMFDIRLVENHV